MIKIIKSSEIDENWYGERSFSDTSDVVKKIVDDVIKNGDDAIRCYSKKFDVACPDRFLIDEADLKAAAEKLKREKPDLYDAILYSRDLALKFATKQKASFDDFEMEIADGMFTGQKTIPAERAGVYVPAGRFPLFSTVIMTTTPAVAAGVSDIILCTPPKKHPKNEKLPYADESIMATAYICGVKKCYACGGSQAIAAMAYGTETIPAVDVIVGPGNKFVAEAKKMVFGKVGIDMVAGPTEVFIIADNSANPEWVAADLLAQAEHDVVAMSVLACVDENFAKKVQAEIEKQLETLPTADTARQSIENCGKIIVCSSLEEALKIANKKAPEHLEVAMSEGAERDKLCDSLRNYGSLFIGHYSAEVFGDYAAGLNHTLPTSGAARYTGGLSVRVFLKTVTTLRATKASCGLKKSAVAANVLGEAEGLAGHARAARARMED